MKISINKFISENKTAIIGALAIMLAAFLWSLDGTFIRPKFYTYPATLIVFLEHALGFIVLCPFIILNWSKIKLLSRKDWGAIGWVCIFGGLLGTIWITKAFFAAVHGEVTFATVVILQKLQPVFVLLMARLILGERLSRRFYLWAIVAIAAAYFLAFGKTGLDLKGINILHSAAFFAFLAAFAFGSSTVFGKRIVNHLDYKATAALRFGITTILAFLVVIFGHNLSNIKLIDNLHWGYLFIIVFSSGALAMFIYYYGLKRVTASTATICELFWPLSAVILDYILNKNVLNTIQIIASIVLLLAFYKVVTTGQRKKIEFTATRIGGAGRGERLGFPTINLDKVDLDIDHGVYLVRANINDKNYQGLLHFGHRVTFGDNPSLELYIKEYLENISNENVRVEIIKKVREVKRFNTEEELKRQIEEDIGILGN